MVKLWSYYNIVCVWIYVNLGILIVNLIFFKFLNEYVKDKYCGKW